MIKIGAAAFSLIVFSFLMTQVALGQTVTPSPTGSTGTTTPSPTTTVPSGAPATGFGQ